MSATIYEHVKSVYGNSTQPLDNESLYQKVAKCAGISADELNHRSHVGSKSAPRSKIKRAIRWAQQTLKASGWLEKTEDRGVWQLTKSGKQHLTRISDGYSIVAFTTDYGVAIWGNCVDAFRLFREPLSLICSSPPYPLKCARAYGNVAVDKYIDFMCTHLEPTVKKLKPGGSIALNLSNDIFESQSPARSLYLEKLTIALCERLGLSLMDRLIWNCPNKIPAPVQWASKKRVQLNSGHEFVSWFTNDPSHVYSNNKRVLQEHSSSHLKLINRGGERRTAEYSDGAYKIRHGSFANETPGRIPKNVLTFSNTCHSQRSYKRMSRELGLPVHGAPMPLQLAIFLIQFLTEDSESEIVADPFGGSLTTAVAAEILGRGWVASEIFWEYLRGAATRFHANLNPFFSTIR